MSQPLALTTAPKNLTLTAGCNTLNLTVTPGTVGIVDTFSTNASRTLLTSNIYLWRDAVPTNLTPLILPFNATLYAISASGAQAQTWQAQVHAALALVPGAVLNIVAATSAFDNALSIDFNQGDRISVFLSGTLIDRPNVDLFFRRR